MLSKISRFLESLQHRVRRTVLEHRNRNRINNIRALRQEKLSLHFRLSGPIKGDAPPTPEQNLLEQRCIQWQQGDWYRLAELDLAAIEGHADRSTLVLLSASAKMQLGEIDSAQKLIKQAENWGCKRSVIAEFLIAGVHNNLARASILTGRNASAKLHFNRAISSRSMRDRTEYPADYREQEQRRQLFLSGSYVKSKARTNKDATSPSDSTLSLIDFLDCENSKATLSLNGTANINGRDVSFDDQDGAIPLPFFYRPDSKGDLGVLQQIFQEKQYECGWLQQGKKLLELANKIRDEGSTPAIIDGGANIGASTVWFAKRYPGSVVLAIEPDHDNCELLRNNCASLPVRVFNGGLADCRKELFLEDPGQSDWGYRLAGNGSIPVQCIGVTDILRYCEENSLTPLILKLDIEGGEEAVFAGDASWIKTFPVVIIELHDWLFPDKTTSQNFLRAAANAGLQIFTRGENLFCFNREYKFNK